MHEPDLWTHCAEAMEYRNEGNRLIAKEIAQAIRDLWRYVVRSVDGQLQSLGKHGLPPG